jgi:hypothetical protein
MRRCEIEQAVDDDRRRAVQVGAVPSEDEQGLVIFVGDQLVGAMP